MKGKKLAILLCFFLTVSLTAGFPSVVKAATGNWTDYKADFFAGGDGTEGDPFQIATAGQLALLTQNTIDDNNYSNGKSFVLTADIDLGEHYWEPIAVFKGILDGHGFVIHNLQINDSSEQRLGLVSTMDGATVKDLGIVGADITGLRDTGALVGWVDGNTTDISRCYSTGSVMTIDDTVGGLVGWARNMSIINCYSTCDVSSTHPYSNAGGLIGNSYSSVAAINCYAAGVVTNPNSNQGRTGGIVGGVDSSVSVTNSYYNSSNAAGYGGTAELLDNMKSSDFITTLNNGQDPAVWKADTGNTNDGLPLLAWQQSLSIVATGAVSNLTLTSADVEGNVTSDGGSAVTARGFVYGANANPVIGGAGVTNVTAGSGIGAFSSTLSGLTENTSYYVSAYATNGEGTSYGADVTFTTTTASNGGGSRSTSLPPPAYKAEVKEGTVQSEPLPVIVDTTLKTGIVSLGAAKAEELFNSSTGAVITMPSIPGVNTYTLELPAASLSDIQGTDVLTLASGTGSIAIPSNMLSALSGTDGKKAGITIGQGNKAGLSDEEKTAIGDRPIIQLTLTLDGKKTEWNNPDAPVTVSIPYAPTAEELKNPENIVIWYIDGSGKSVCMPNGYYEPATGTVAFTTTHFSYYAVGYNKLTFKDVAANVWYNKAVSFIAARGITTGTSNGNYSPDAKLTRGEFIVLLMRAYGITPDTDPKDNFADAGNIYYTKYLAAAKRLGISGGVGDNLYAPDKQITRQEMFTLLYNALKVVGRLPEGTTGKPLSSFSDTGQIASWSKDAMTLLVRTETISGSNGKLSPTSTTTRAEMAQVLYNLLSK